MQFVAEKTSCSASSNDSKSFSSTFRRTTSLAHLTKPASTNRALSRYILSSSSSVTGFLAFLSSFHHFSSFSFEQCYIGLHRPTPSSQRSILPLNLSGSGSLSHPPSVPLSPSCAIASVLSHSCSWSQCSRLQYTISGYFTSATNS